MAKTKISISIDEELLKNLEYTWTKIEKAKPRNRSVMVEEFLRKAIERQKCTTAIILAGGKGTRLRPLTYEVPKPLVPIKGKPLIMHTIEQLSKNGVKNFVIAVGYKAEEIIKTLGDGSSLGVNIKYSIEKTPLGTGGAVKKAASLVEEFPVLVVNGDNLFKLDIAKFFDSHMGLKYENPQLLGTIALTTVNDVTGYGVVTLEGGYIKEFIEKPTKEVESNIINAGIYLAEKELIEMIPSNKFVSMEKDIFQEVSKEGKLGGFVFNGPWYPTDNFERYELAIKKWKP